MANSLIDSLTSLITPDIVSKAASQFGESEAAMARAVPAGIPAILAGLLGKANDSSAMGSLFSLIKDPANDGSALSNLSGLLGGGGAALAGLGGKFLNLLFGDRLGAITGALGQSTGVRTSTGSSILGLIAPLVMAFLGNRARTEGLNASGLSNLLLSQKDSILSALPPGLSSLLGAARPAAPVAAAAAPVRRSTAWIWPLLILAVLGLWWLLRRRPEPQAVEIAAPAATTTHVFVKRSVCGSDINVAQDGIEPRLIGFVEDTGRPVDETTWFEFDRLTFETNSASLKPESSEQLRNVAAILKCFPAVKVKIGGYTDNTGDAAANLKLSQARAESVDRELVGMGVASDRLTAEGYGADHPVADNSTEEGRAKNRRIALRVAAK